jgi:hypothetical protein
MKAGKRAIIIFINDTDSYFLAYRLFFDFTKENVNIGALNTNKYNAKLPQCQ